MIESISISGKEVSYIFSSQNLEGLKAINFIYGANGSGKTTISKIIANPSNFASCSVRWKSGHALEPFVYNRDFVAVNFGQSTDLKGIFTLGEKDTSAIDVIKAVKVSIDDLNEGILTKKATLEGADGGGGKRAELKTLESQFEEKCWALKRKYDEVFKEAFKRFRDKKARFKESFISESESNNSIFLTFEALSEKAKTVYSESPPERFGKLPTLLFDDLTTLEQEPVLLKKVIGKGDVDIAAMISKLGNSDWVKQGRAYYDVNDGICPFCQQETDAEFAESLNEYFDEAFIKDTAAIEQLRSSYLSFFDRVVQSIQSILDKELQFINNEVLKNKKDLLISIMQANKQLIEKKQKEASLPISLQSLKNNFSEINELINEANTKIDHHNEIVDNLGQEKSNLTASVWKFVVSEIKTDYEQYKKSKNDIDKAIKGLNNGITEKTNEKNKLETQLRQLEKNFTSIQPTVDAINALLKSFGFLGFSLAKATNQEGYYKIIRPDGSEAKETLSEGEKTFITFLYFYHLLKGSNFASGMTTDRVVVFDDPVSSLDSDVLFIVSNLIKGLFVEVRATNGYIKQIFVLTHNVYFHKEITFRKNKSADKAFSDETFWIVRKFDTGSKFQKHDQNPIKTSYELLWNEVKSEQHSNLTIQNTLRRIIENYFKILGGIDPNDIVNKFNGQDKVVCGSLLSWVNDGSHFANDDLYMTLDDTTVETYLSIFKQIFEESKHISHYNMMMGIQ